MRKKQSGGRNNQQSVGLSIIIPVFNSEGWISRTLQGIEKSLSKSSLDAEIIVIDDGSTDNSTDEVMEFKKRYKGKLTLIPQENKGRYIARKAGVESSTKDSILFIDSRIDVDEMSLRFLEGELQKDQDQIWNGHVHVAKEGNIFARFWDAITCIAWRRYFKDPKQTSYGIDEFDHYPKGTGFFFVPKKRLLAAMRFFEKNTNDLEFSSDDTLLIRYLAERKEINLSPSFSCVYHGRSTLKGFLKHAYNRGQFFVDGFLRKGTRFFYPLLVVLLLSVIAAVSLMIAFFPTIFYLLAALGLFVVALFVGAVMFGVGRKDAGSLAVLGVPFAVVYMAGIWRGVLRKKPHITIWKTLTDRRKFLSGTALEYIGVAAGYFAALSYLTEWIVFNISSQIYASPGDSTAGFMWLTHAIPGIDPVLTHTDEANYPVGESVGGPTFVTYAMIWLPIRLATYLTDPVAGVNLVMFLGYMTSAMSMYWLVKRLTNNWAVALFAGYAVAFTPYALYKSSSHIAYIFSAPFTLMLASFIALWRRSTVRRALLLSLTISLAFYVDGYYLLLASVMATGLVIGGFLYSAFSGVKKDELLLKVRTVLISVAGVAVFSIPIFMTQFIYGDNIQNQLGASRGNIASEIETYSSNKFDFILPARSHPVLGEGGVFRDLYRFKNQAAGNESLVYVGYTIFALTTIGGATVFAALLMRKRNNLKIGRDDLDMLLLLGAVTFVLVPLFLAFMLSPGFRVLGVYVPLAGQLLIDMHIDFWRVMSRFYVPLQVVMVIFAAFVLHLLSTLVRVPKGNVLYRMRAVAAYVLIFSMLGVTAFEFTINPDGRPYDFKRQTPEGYVWLKNQDNIDVVAELPLVDPLYSHTSAYLTAQLVHGKKIVNMRDASAERLTNALGDSSNPELINFLRERNVDAVLLRDNTCADSYGWGRLLHESDYYGIQNLCIYSLLEAPSDDAFVVFGEGFRPDFDAMKVGKYRALSVQEYNTISITSASLKNDLDKGNKVKLIGLLENTSGQNMQWSIEQDGMVPQRGAVESGGTGSIMVALDGSKEVTIILSIKIPIESVRAALKDVIVTEI